MYETETQKVSSIKEKREVQQWNENIKNRKTREEKKLWADLRE